MKLTELITEENKQKQSNDDQLRYLKFNPYHKEFEAAGFRIFVTGGTGLSDNKVGASYFLAKVNTTNSAGKAVRADETPEQAEEKLNKIFPKFKKKVEDNQITWSKDDKEVVLHWKGKPGKKKTNAAVDYHRTLSQAEVEANEKAYAQGRKDYEEYQAKSREQHAEFLKRIGR